MVGVAFSEYRGNELSQRPDGVAFGDQGGLPINPDLKDRVPWGGPVWRRELDGGALGEFSPVAAIVTPGGVHSPAAHLPIACDLGNRDLHLFSLCPPRPAHQGLRG
jgi:hypothetical protein